VASVLERTLVRLLGPSAALDLLLERALLEVFDSWPARADTPLPLWGQRIAVSRALEALNSKTPVSNERRVRPGRVRNAVSHLQAWMRAARPEDQLAFALLEFNASSIDEAAAICCVPAQVVRARAGRLRRGLLFAARRDLELRRYLLLATRLRSLLRCWDRARLRASPSERARRVSAELELELQWFA
jgi:DNA-directed RNA polymerase specialized sigma24 family protein